MRLIIKTNDYLIDLRKETNQNERRNEAEKEVYAYINLSKSKRTRSIQDQATDRHQYLIRGRKNCVRKEREFFLFIRISKLKNKHQK